MADDARVQDGTPLWGTATQPATGRGEGSPETPRPSGPPPWGTAQRPRGPARRATAPRPEPSGQALLKGPALALLVGLVVLVPFGLAFERPADHAARVLENGTMRTATVVEVRHWPGLRDIALRYEQDGRSRTVHRATNARTPPLSAGDTLSVWVDPQDPGWAAARDLDPVPGWAKGLILPGWVVGSVVLLCGGFAFLGALYQLAGTWLARSRPGRVKQDS